MKPGRKKGSKLSYRVVPHRPKNYAVRGLSIDDQLDLIPHPVFPRTEHHRLPVDPIRLHYMALEAQHYLLRIPDYRLPERLHVAFDRMRQHYMSTNGLALERDPEVLASVAHYVAAIMRGKVAAYDPYRTTATYPAYCFFWHAIKQATLEGWKEANKWRDRWVDQTVQIKEALHDYLPEFAGEYYSDTHWEDDIQLGRRK